MKAKILPVLTLLCILINPLNSKAQAIDTQDSLALVDIYNNCNGISWHKHANWLTTASVST